LKNNPYKVTACLSKNHLRQTSQSSYISELPVSTVKLKNHLAEWFFGLKA